MWVVGLLVYMLAVFHRSSLGVAGLAATERFDISAAQLATFTMLQLLVYAGMQIPVGLLVDRFGSRSVLLVGLVLMTLAQAGFAFAESYPVALLARAVVGVGDAMTFICVLRLVSSWFPARRIPLVTQLTGTLGQLGAVRGGGADDLGAGPARLDARPTSWPPASAWSSSWRCCSCSRRPGAPARARAADVAAAVRPEPGGLLGAPGHPPRLLDALHHPVQRHHAEPAVGLPVLRAAARGGPRRPRACC